MTFKFLTESGGVQHAIMHCRFTKVKLKRYLDFYGIILLILGKVKINDDGLIIWISIAAVDANLINDKLS